MNRKTIILSTVICVLGASGVYGQLTDADIEALRERGKREGWTFEVGRSSATERPLHMLCGALLPEKEPEAAPYPVRGNLPVRFDWRDHWTLPGVRDQGSCGSCWAFAAIGAVECNFAIRQPDSPMNYNLSEQWLVSCTDAGSCSGGDYINAMNYLKWDGALAACDQNGGMYEWSFAYDEDDLPCNCPYAPAFWIDSYGLAGHQDPEYIDSIKQAIYDHGPVAAFTFVTKAFSAYDEGVFNACAIGPDPGGHAIVLVGWDDSQGSNGIWYLRNSWGSGWLFGWGEGGYMRIEYGCLSVGYNTYWVERSPKVWVDFGYTGAEDGGYSRPYNNLSEALAEAHGGTRAADWSIRMKPGSTPETLTISQPVRLEAIGGAVVIGG